MVTLSLLVGFQHVVMVVCFKLNQEGIEQEFCVNKHNVELQCHGGCYLEKILRETQDSKSASTSLYNKVDLFLNFMMLEIKNRIVKISNTIPKYKGIHYIDPYKEVLEPPPISQSSDWINVIKLNFL